MKKYTVSILTYKALDHSKRCIESVLEHSDMAQTNLILTANGSEEARRYFFEVKTRFPDSVTVVSNEKNQGFIKPNNHAFKLCTTDYFVLLNDDVKIMQTRWLEVLNEPFQRFQTAALSGPKGTCQSIDQNFHGYLGPAMEYIEGSMMMIKCAALGSNQLFPDWLSWAYGEDAHLSLDMRRLGYSIHKVGISFTHAQAQTSKHVPEVKENQARNHVALRRHWAHYLQARRMDFPIVVKRTAAHGDVLLTTPIIKALKLAWPTSPITVDTQPCMYPLFEGNPHIVRCATQVARSIETMYINLDMAYENRPETSILDAYAKAASVVLSDRVTEIFTPYAKDGEPGWIAIHPGPTTWIGKNWPLERWDELARFLRSYYGYKILLIGHGNSLISCDRDIRGRTSFAELAAEIAKCELFIGVDSFPIHVAQAVKTPVIGLFGVTSAKYILTDGSKWLAAEADPAIAETGSRHRSTGQVVTQSNGEAMRSISVKQVLDLVDQFQ